MSNYFEKVKDYLLDLDYDITIQDVEDEVLVIQDEDSGINNLVLAVADPILIVEQSIFELKSDSSDVYKKLLQKNRDIVHGAFALDDDGKKVLFRDTLELENLDLNEIEGSLNSLSLLLSEFSHEIIAFSKQ